MKNTLSLAILLLLLSSCTDEVILFNHSNTAFNIVTGSDPDSNTIICADILHGYLKRITGLSFTITGEPAPGKKSIFIGAHAAQDESLADTLAITGDEGFIILIDHDRIVLAGAKPLSTYYAVTTFLEEYLGCMKFTGSEEFVPSPAKVVLQHSYRRYEPAFPFRHPHFPDRLNTEYASWHKISSFDNWGLFVHTFQKLCSPEIYFDKHPEYFSLVGGKRIWDGQLCLSNPAVISLLGDNLEAMMVLQPEREYWSVSQNDCINYCECDSCKKQYEKYGAISGSYIAMANSLAARFPDKQISTLAYQFTREAPVNIMPLDNVNIMFCSIECNRSMPLADDPRSAGFVKDMKDWQSLSENIFVWDYVVQFKTYLCPFPNFSVLQPNIQFFRDHKARMMFQQGSGTGWSDLCELKQYLIAKLLWDPDVNADSVISRFCNLYYGPAAEYILSYHRLSEATLKEHREDWNLDIYGLPSNYFRTFLTGLSLKEYRDLMDNAERSVEHNEIYLGRVLKTRCAVDFAFIDYALNAGDASVSFISARSGKKVADNEMLSFLDRFMANCERSGITNIGEEKLTIKEYYAHIRTILGLSLRENLAAGRAVKSLTQFNPRYSDPGAAALTDGIFGGRHFNAGWLGYQGEDMIVEIDLGRPVQISRVSMNFLRDFVSWVFLPVEISISISDNGNNYRPVAVKTNEITDRRFGVEPVFHSFEFSPQPARYIKVNAVSMRECPEWHRGAGQPSWVFCDEIIIE